MYVKVLLRRLELVNNVYTFYSGVYLSLYKSKQKTVELTVFSETNIRQFYKK